MLLFVLVGKHRIEGIGPRLPQDVDVGRGIRPRAQRPNHVVVLLGSKSSSTTIEYRPFEPPAEQLKAMAVEGLQQAARETGINATVEHSEHFRPSRPEPTHRMAMP